MTVCKNIRDIRKNAGMTQKELSELTGIPKRTIENWENEYRKCPKYTLKLIDFFVNNYLKEK